MSFFTVQGMMDLKRLQNNGTSSSLPQGYADEALPNRLRFWRVQGGEDFSYFLHLFRALLRILVHGVGNLMGFRCVGFRLFFGHLLVGFFNGLSSRINRKPCSYLTYSDKSVTAFSHSAMLSLRIFDIATL